MVDKKGKGYGFCLIDLVCSFVLTMLLLIIIKKYLGVSGLEHNILSILVFAAIHILLKKYRGVKAELSYRKRKYLFIFCICIAASEIMGLYLTRNGSILAYDLEGAVVEIFMAMAVAIILFLTIAVLKQRKPFLCNKEPASVKTPIRDWLIIMVGWCPVLLAYYPGIFAYDASDQVLQVLTGVYSEHHPVLHTLLLGGLFKFGNFLGNNSLGVLMYSIIQMSVVAGAIAWAVDYMKEKGLSRSAYIILMIFYIFFPVNSMLVISTTKDILFAAFGLIVMIFLMKVTDKPDLWKKKRLFLTGSLALAGMMLFRNNAIYACILCCPVLVFLKKKFWKNYLGWIVLSLIIAGGVNLSMGMLLQPEKGSMVEMLSVPLQQMARVGYYHSEELDSAEREELYYFIPEEVVAQYAPNIADAVKNHIDDNFIKNDLFRFIKLYIKLGIAWPREYLDAFFCLTQGFWYIEDTSHAQIYGVGMESRLGYMLTNYKTMPEGYEVVHISYLPQLEYFLEKMFSDNKYLEVPLLSILFAPAFWEWILAAYVGSVLYRKQYDMLIPVILLACYQVTLLLGPVCIIRYVYPVVICMPILLIKKFQMIKNIYPSKVW